MNQISNYLRGDNPLGDEYAAAVERLVQAAKKSKELIQHSNGCSLRYYTSRQVCDCGYIEVKQELNAALEPFREVSDG